VLPVPEPGALYRVVYGDTLGALALKLYGHASRVDQILAVNPTISDPDRIFIGQIIYLPPLPT
jgi:nucleoid-associated protein YgaU